MKARISLPLRDNAEAPGGRRPVVTMRLGASDSRLYRLAGIPAAVYRPTPHNMGEPAFDFLSPAG